ncbi:Calx-beta domain-containing protein [Wocania ichthyoenteri]|uniref:Calx-beta domain-containing protein n=1 Tax=Wocania ichthyoenteri TaxID=1230531 RepID=UPI00053E044D|nr:Calx-beta domain-containing protein [Wocania ichthyoenteri]
MKILKSILYITIVLLSLGCEEEPQLYDFERYKFVSFISEEISTLENAGTQEIFLRYDGSVLKEDFSVTLSITGTAQEGVDYNVDSKTVLFKAGEIKSEPFSIEIIDNLLDGTEDLNLEISIESVSNPNIDIGVGVVNQSNKSIVLTLVDDECPEDIDIFATDLINEKDKTISASINGNVLSLTGNLINYGAFPNANLEITLTPVVAGAKIGSVTFDDFDAGLANDGYQYQFRLAEEGVYEVCTGKINVKFWVYYLSGGTTGNWVYWYAVNTELTIP